MKRILKVEGIVLKRQTLADADRILTLLTRTHGKVRVVAKGVRKITSRRAAHVEVFTRLQATLYKGKGLAILTEAQSISPKPIASDNLLQVSYAYYACELVDRLLPDEERHDDVYALLLSMLVDISQSPRGEYDRLSYTFAITLLQKLGFLPVNHDVSQDQIDAYIERILERRIATPRLLTKIQREY